MTTPLTLIDVEQGLLAAIQTALDNANPSGPTIAQAYLTPGEVADDECMCGTLIISEVQRYASADFPAPLVQGTTDNCGAPWLVVELKVSLGRCVPLPDDSGNGPDPADLTDAAIQLSNDQGTMRRAAGCYLRTLYNTHQVPAYDIGTQLPRGPLGGCVTAELQVFIGLTNGCGC